MANRPPQGRCRKQTGDRTPIECLRMGDAGMQKVPIERLQVPKVENDAMPFQDGALVQKLRRDQFKESIRLPAGLRKPSQEHPLGFHIFRDRNQACLLIQLMMGTTR